MEQIENIRKLSNVFCQGVDFEYKYACCTRLATLSTLESTGLCTAAFVKLTYGLTFLYSYMVTKRS